MSKEIEFKVGRIPTGIKGLDKLIEGGFVKGSSILVSGNTGTGKTIFCLQYLYEGLKRGESCIYITLEESAKDIIDDALALGIDLKEYIKKGKFKIIEKNVFEDTSIDFFTINRTKATRIVIDPFSLLALSIQNKPIIRQKLYEIIKMLKERGVTLLLTSEALENETKYSRHDIEEFVVDGLIKLEMEIIGADLHRSINIIKMRKTKMKGGRHNIEISKGGIKLTD
ncbi:MAG TPA: hypothetical protein EYP80_01705 [Candidatus Aenigmarchaeota archaeon]|nr:hypothetical protein [Candidatus Aenigmarchaeota archaeon]